MSSRAPALEGESNEADVDLHQLSADQQNAIRREQEAFPLISQRQLLADDCDLMIELASNDDANTHSSFATKLASLYKTKKYSSVRYMRKDGSCFYRAAMFRLFETVLQCVDEPSRNAAAKSLEERVTARKEAMVRHFSEFVEDFLDVFLEILGEIKTGAIATADQLHAKVTSNEFSEYVIAFARYAVSEEMRSNPDDYSPFIEGGQTVEQFCSSEVEAIGQECGQLQIIAFTRFFNVHVVVEYLDLSAGETTTAHEFGDLASSSVGGSITLLYRPGHYDLVYV